MRGVARDAPRRAQTVPQPARGRVRVLERHTGLDAREVVRRRDLHVVAAEQAGERVRARALRGAER